MKSGKLDQLIKELETGGRAMLEVANALKFNPEILGDISAGSANDETDALDKELVAALYGTTAKTLDNWRSKKDRGEYTGDPVYTGDSTDGHRYEFDRKKVLECAVDFTPRRNDVRLITFQDAAKIHGVSERQLEIDITDSPDEIYTGRYDFGLGGLVFDRKLLAADVLRLMSLTLKGAAL